MTLDNSFNDKLSGTSFINCSNGKPGQTTIKVLFVPANCPAKIFIDNNFTDRITIDEIAGKSFFSKFHFIRLFKTAYGTTPHQYVIKVRIEKAKLLLQTKMSIAAACNAVGFDSISTFRGLFKQVVAITPSSYKKEQAERGNAMQKAPLRFIPSCFTTQCGWT